MDVVQTLQMEVMDHQDCHLFGFMFNLNEITKDETPSFRNIMIH